MPMFYLKLCIDVYLIQDDTIFVCVMRDQSAVLPRISFGVVAFLVHEAHSAEGSSSPRMRGLKLIACRIPTQPSLMARSRIYQPRRSYVKQHSFDCHNG